MKSFQVYGVAMLGFGILVFSQPVLAKQNNQQNPKLLPPQNSQIVLPGQTVSTTSSGSFNTWSAFDELDQVQEKMERLLRNLKGDQLASFPRGKQGTPGGFTYSPDVDLIESEKEYRIELDLPGMEKEQINLAVQQGILTISGERKPKVDEEQAEGYYYRGRTYGSFTHSMELPENANEDAIDAKYENGVLILTIPKRDLKPVAPPKQIKIQ